MSEEVKIRITNEVDTGPISKEKKEILDLHKAADSYQKKGMNDAAKSARSEAYDLQKSLIGKRTVESAAARESGNIAAANAMADEAAEMEATLSLQKRLNLGYEEATVLARTQLAEEKAITKQKAEQAALKKAGVHGGGGLLGGNARMAGEMLDTATGSQGWVMRMMGLNRLPHMLGALAANPIALGALAVGGVAAYQYKAFEERQKDEAQRNRIGEESLKDRRTLAREAGAFGSSGEIASQEFSTKDELADRIAHSRELERQKNAGIGGIIDRFAGTHFADKNIFGFKTSGARAVEENEQEIKRLQGKLRDEDKERRAKFDNEEGGLGLQIERDTAQHSAGGMRQRRVDRGTLEWLQEYKRLIAEGAQEWQANEGAMMKVQEQQRQIAIGAAAGLVNARSGAGDVAQAANLATQMNDWGATLKSIDAKHTEMLSHMRTSTERLTRADHGG